MSNNFKMPRLAKPDPGTHWKFSRGVHVMGVTPTFILVDEASGDALERIYLDHHWTRFGIWWDSWQAVNRVREKAQRQKFLDQLASPKNGEWEV